MVNKKKPVEPGDNTPLKPYDPDGGNDIPPLTPPTPPTRIEDNPVPEGNKTIPKVPEVPEVPLTHEIPEGVPELPKTDGVPAGAFSLFGLALAVLGLLFKRSK